jgi:hypothetical protein
MTTFILKKSGLPQKKYQVTDIVSGKTIHFGAAGYSDYTLSKNKQKKSAYIARHSVRSNFNDLNSAASWSRFILWNKPTIEQSVQDMEKRFDIKIINLTQKPI